MGRLGFRRNFEKAVLYHNRALWESIERACHMKKILVTFLVLLAVCSLSLTLVPGAHSQTSSVKILSYSWYVDTAGYFDVVGEVQNIGTNTLSQVVLTGTVYSSDGTAQSNSYTQIGIENMPVNDTCSPANSTFLYDLLPTKQFT